MIKDEIINLIYRQEREREIEVTEDSNLNDIGIDSIGFIAMVVEIEERFEFEFDDDKLNNKCFQKVSELISYIEEKRKR